MTVASTHRAVRRRGGRNLFADLFRYVAMVRRTHRDMARLEHMSEDQLRDVGLDPWNWKGAVRNGRV